MATSSAVFPLACTAHDTESATARTALSPAGSEAETSASAVVTILPSTADFPTPGDPVTTNARRSGFSRLSHFVIAVSASDRPRKRNPRSLSPLTPRPLGFQCRTPSGSRSSVHPQAARSFRYFGPAGWLMLLCSRWFVESFSLRDAGMVSARVSRRLGRAVPRAARRCGLPPFFTRGRGAGSVTAGRVHDDLVFPGHGGLGR